MLFYNKLCYVAFCYITLLYCNKMAWYNPSGTGRLNMVYQYLGLCSDILYMVPHEMTFVVCEFHITSHLLCLASGGATNSPSHVLYMGVSYSRQHAHGTLNPDAINNALCSGVEYTCNDSPECLIHETTFTSLPSSIYSTFSKSPFLHTAISPAFSKYDQHKWQ